MNLIAYAASAVAVLAALLVITRRNGIHALLALIAMLLSQAVLFLALGAPFVAVLQVAIYAGAIMVLFVFVVMMLNLGPPAERRERRWLAGSVWVVPVLLAGALLLLSYQALAAARGPALPAATIGPKPVGLALYGEYVLAVELASLLLLAGLVGAFHLAPPTREVVLPEAPSGEPRSQAEEACHVSRR